MQSIRYIYCRVLEWSYTQTLSGEISLKFFAQEKVSTFLGGQEISISLYSDPDTIAADLVGEFYLINDLNEYGIPDFVEGSIVANQSYIYSLFDSMSRTSIAQNSQISLTLATTSIELTEQMAISDFSLQISHNLAITNDGK